MFIFLMCLLIGGCEEGRCHWSGNLKEDCRRQENEQEGER